MKWMWEIIWNPVEAFDLVDKNGEPDHGKIMGFCAFVVFVAANFGYAILPSATLCIIFLAAMFGPRMFYKFLERSSVNASESKVIFEDLRKPSANDSAD